MSREEGWALFKTRIFKGEEYEGYCLANYDKANVAFSFDGDFFGKSSIFCNGENSSTKQRLPFACGRQTHMLFTEAQAETRSPSFRDESSIQSSAEW